MAMVCGLDLHRRQITFDVLEVSSGEEWRGRIWQPDRERFRRWLRSDLTRRAGRRPVALAVEGCTGWRYVERARGIDPRIVSLGTMNHTAGRRCGG